MTCRELVELVTDYFEGALTRRDRRRFEKHVSTCDGCAAYLAQLRDLHTALGGLADEDVPEETVRELGAAFRDWSSSRL